MILATSDISFVMHGRKSDYREDRLHESPNEKAGYSSNDYPDLASGARDCNRINVPIARPLLLVTFSLYLGVISHAELLGLWAAELSKGLSVQTLRYIFLELRE
jgi:hypothetical protein